MLAPLLDQLGLSALSHRPRQTLSQLQSFLLIVAGAFMTWKALSLATNCSSPIVVVLSGSMEPAFQRGDILFLWNRNLDLPYNNPASSALGGTQVGEVVVYNVAGKNIPIVHRVVRRHRGGPLGGKGKGKGKKTPTMLLTKGDNNPTDDLDLYARGQYYVDREKEVIGSVVAYLPLVGYITILLEEHPWLKAVMLGGFGLLAVLQQE